jgi:hypothetical protein
MKLTPAVRELKRQLRDVNREIDALAPHGYCPKCLSTDVYWHNYGGGRRYLADWNSGDLPHKWTCRGDQMKSEAAFAAVEE